MPEWIPPVIAKPIPKGICTYQNCGPHDSEWMTIGCMCWCHTMPRIAELEAALAAKDAEIGRLREAITALVSVTENARDRLDDVHALAQEALMTDAERAALETEPCECGAMVSASGSGWDVGHTKECRYWAETEKGQ